MRISSNLENALPFSRGNASICVGVKRNCTRDDLVVSTLDLRGRGSDA